MRLTDRVQKETHPTDLEYGLQLIQTLRNGGIDALDVTKYCSSSVKRLQPHADANIHPIHYTSTT